MPTFLVRWPNDEVVITTANSKHDVFDMLDAICDPSSCHITELHQHIALSFKASLKPTVRRKGSIDAEKRLGAGLLGDDLGAAWKAGALDCTSDLRIRIEPPGAVACEFQVHKTILAARCGYFQTFFSQQESFAALLRSEEDGLPVLKMEDTDSETFKLFLHLLYTDQMPPVFDSYTNSDIGDRVSMKPADAVLWTQQAVRLLVLADFLMAASLKRSLLSVTASCISKMASLCLSEHNATTDELCIAAAEVLVHTADALAALADVDELTGCVIEKLADQCEDPKLKAAVFDSLSDGVAEKLAAVRSKRTSVDISEVSMPYGGRGGSMAGFTGVIDALVDPTVLSQWREANDGPGGNGRPDPFATSPPLQAATLAAVATRQAAAAAAKRAAELVATNAAMHEDSAEECGVNRSGAQTKKEEGNAAFKRKQFDQAVRFYSDAIELDPHHAEYYSNRSLAYARLQGYSDALKDAETAIKVDPYFGKGYIRKATALASMGQNRAAVLALVTGFDSLPSGHDDKKMLYKQLQQQVESVALALRRQEFLNDHSVTKFEYEECGSPSLASLEFVRTDEFYESETSLTKAVNELFFPEAARVAEAQQHEYDERLYGEQSSDEDGEDAGEAMENTFRDAIAADSATFQSKALALTSMDYFRWLRGDNGASEGLGGNRYLHEQSRRM